VIPVRPTLSILLVTDRAADAVRFDQSLAQATLATFRLVVVPNLADGVTALARHGFDAVVLDQELADADDPEWPARIRAVSPRVPVLVLVPQGREERGLRALGAGVQDWLSKGQLAPELLERSLGNAVWRARASGITRSRESELEHIAAGIPGAVYQYRVAADGTATFPFVSAGILELAGITPAELQRAPAQCFHLILPEDAALLQDTIRRSAETLQPWVREFRIDLGQHRLKWIRASAVPTREPDGATLWNGIFVDVSEQRVLEDQLRQAQKMEAVGQLAGGVAHDFNNLLTAIVSSSELAAGELEENHPVREYLDEIQRATERAADLTRQLIAFSRRQVLRLETLDLAEVVLDCERMLRRVIREDVRLETHLEESAPPVRADRGQLGQILMNLVVNARDAMLGAGVLTIATGYREVDAATASTQRGLAPGAYTLLVVQDTGMGMDDAVRARIFEPFFTTKDPGKGTGLGLSTVYGIVKQVGGYIQVESAPGSGAKFTIHLPSIRGVPAKRAPAPPVRTQLRGTETVLIAEDEAGVRLPTRRILVAHGYRVLEACDGMTALALAERHEGVIDLLLTDVVMPGMGGAELARRLRMVRPELRVVYMSGYSTEAVATHGILTPGATFLQKPFSIEELAGQIRDILDSPAR
jgi:signal transduction histidine kinase